jgi:hypothetical protein
MNAQSQPFTVGVEGFARHVWDFDPIKDRKKLVTSRKYILAVETIFCFASGLIKVSILLFYRRLSSRVVSKAFRWTTWISIGSIIAYTIALTLAPLLGCQPFSAFWDQVDIFKRLQGYKFHCFDEGADVFAASVISAFQDLITAILPTFLYWNLQISLRQKFALFGIFAIGYGVVGLGTLRAYYSYRTFYLTYDVTWSTYDLFFTSLLELHVGAFCANAPTMKVFFKHFFQDKFTSSSRYHGKNSAHSSSKASKASTNLFSKITGFLSTSRSTRGYISDANTSVSVDPHGVIAVQKEKEIDMRRNPAAAFRPNKKHESANTINLLNQHYYSSNTNAVDIELGDYKPDTPASPDSMHSFEGEDITALPALPASPTKARSVRSHRSFASMRTRVPESPVLPAEQRMSLPVAVDEMDEREFRSATPMPMPLSMSMPASGAKPAWQSWS